AFNFGAPPSSNTRWDLYPLRQPWVESQVTWQVFATAMPWQVPGAWGAKDVKGTAGYLRPISTGPLLAGYIPLSLVQSWVDVPAGNRGAVFTTSRVLPGLGSELWTLTRDPTLTVTFTPPSP
ncbi:MAG: hypothetical protein K0R38_5189, partial [Polyangiaceae bacterium]|nr:hypothetical protein [Polyangiaceae bacterium]